MPTIDILNHIRISFHTFVTRSLKKFDLTHEHVEIVLYNLYPCPLVYSAHDREPYENG